MKPATQTEITPPEVHLEKARQELFDRFLKNRAPNFLIDLSSLFDRYFQERFENSRAGLLMDIQKNPCAILALGGYGRQEQCLMSDIDLLFLFEKTIPPGAEDLVREFILPLWDMGVEVGHATRALKDCVEDAKKDVATLTAMLDARFICGMSRLYVELTEVLRKRLYRKNKKQIITRIVERNLERHKRFGDSSYLLEPHLKEGRGGLRDYHTMLWVSRVAANVVRPRDLVFEGFLSHNEFITLEKALRFIWSARNHLHHLSGKKNDRLLFEDQIKMSGILKVKKRGGLKPVEIFLAELHGHMEWIKRAFLAFMDEPGICEFVKKGRRPGKILMPRGLKAEKGRLDFVSPEAVLKSPFLMMKIFEQSVALNIPLSVESWRLVGEFLYRVDEKFRFSKRALESFEKILMAPNQKFNVLNEMLDAGFLVKFIPEMAGIANRIQYDSYHLYPVDKHLLRAVEIIRNFGSPKDATGCDLCAIFYKSLKKKRLLLWAALLHDIGKGSLEGGHSARGADMARDILTPRGFSQKDVDTVVFLVKRHLLLPKVSSRRDINDEPTVLSCARKIKTVARLKMLYLLSVGDAAATGPNAWNEWNHSLMKELVFKILKMLEKGSLASERADSLVKKKKREISETAAVSPELKDLDFLIEAMSPRYLLRVRPDDIRRHMALFRRMGAEDFDWEVAGGRRSAVRTVTICAKDRPGLMAAIAGVFAVNGMEILEAAAFTWQNGVALDVFKVQPPPDIIFENDKWDKAKKDLQRALSGDLDLGAALEKRRRAYPPERPWPSGEDVKVVVDNSASDFFTIVEVVTGSFSGLLFCITDALFRSGLDVWVAKIGRKVEKVFDVFYVRNFDGEKADAPGDEERIAEEISRAVREKREAAGAIRTL
ncbi:(Protein-PII)-UMP uridylyl-removing enzyme / (Protein-PII) uridylyltransferase [Candidatus Desulfarcum epimagneticum]|uniref:Bifunctional uridylyltransferase/uridylyl-removing enzyme n=1 Tax=uncultured Desulfobacteraceae bacterium TaxID=218296 RepID=A0A484HEM5_9BACT|nr:(Protein-PII)-UMP uridylyl-removing enzyme / (Protein-PII) uridylyltransferase [uncultured Desulfobacteraceae bacterium]